jgi:D-3-phosphoglycerate dehydrogenase
MRVLGYDPHLSPRRLRRIGVRRCNTLEELLSRADYVSIHAPLTEETRNLIGERELRAMKPRAFLINMARGGIVDEPALARALRSGWIAGAATDVFSTEPPPADNPLLSADRIILSPHLAALTGESAVRMAMQAAEGVLDVLKGRTPRYVVNRELLAK